MLFVTKPPDPSIRFLAAIIKQAVAVRLVVGCYSELRGSKHRRKGFHLNWIDGASAERAE